MKKGMCLIPLPLFWEENTNKEYTYIDIPTLETTLRNNCSQRETIFHLDDFFWKTNTAEQAYQFISEKIYEMRCQNIRALGIIAPPFNLNGYFRENGSKEKNLVPVSEKEFIMKGYKRFDLDDRNRTRKVQTEECSMVTFVDEEFENRMIAYSLFAKYAIPINKIALS